MNNFFGYFYSVLRCFDVFYSLYYVSDFDLPLYYFLIDVCPLLAIVFPMLFDASGFLGFDFLRCLRTRNHLVWGVCYGDIFAFTVFYFMFPL